MKNLFRKPEFWVLTLLALVAIAAVAEVMYIRSTMDELSDAVSAVSQAFENESDLIPPTKKLEALWADKCDMLAMLLEHSEIDNIEECLVTLGANARACNSENLAEDIARLDYYIEHVVTLTVPSLKNIF